MRFGLFGSAQAKRGGADVDSGAGFREFVENNVKAEALGYESTFVVEHHFTGFGQISATLNLLTWVGARTKTLRLGTAVITLPWHNPVLLAEQVATLDLLSGGRVDFGIGQGYRHNEFAGFCIPMEEADARFDESLDVLLKAWTSDRPWSHRGKYWQFDNVVVEPPAAQRPHPPLWMGAGRPQSIKKVADLGYNLLLDQFASIEQIGQRIALFKSEVEARGRRFDPMKVAVTRSINVSMTAAERQKALETRMAARERVHDLAQRPDGQNESTIMTYAQTMEATEAGALYGTPDEIAVKLQALRDVGAEYVLLNSTGGIQTLERFAEKSSRRSPASQRSARRRVAPASRGTSAMDAPATNAYWGRDGLDRTILDALRTAGRNVDSLTVDELAPADHFHSGGKSATLRLARLAALRPGLRVLDVGGGLGGPARTLATEFGCRVTVVDLTESYVRAGAALTARLGLGDRVTHRVGDALALDVGGDAFDVVWSQNSGMNIPEKERLYAGFARVLRPGGLLALQEPMAGPVQPVVFPVMWARDAGSSFLRVPGEMRRVIEAAGFECPCLGRRDRGGGGTEHRRRRPGLQHPAHRHGRGARRDRSGRSAQSRGRAHRHDPGGPGAARRRFGSTTSNIRVKSSSRSNSSTTLAGSPSTRTRPRRTASANASARGARVESSTARSSVTVASAPSPLPIGQIGQGAVLQIQHVAAAEI